MAERRRLQQRRPRAPAVAAPVVELRELGQPGRHPQHPAQLGPIVREPLHLKLDLRRRSGRDPRLTFVPGADRGGLEEPDRRFGAVQVEHDARALGDRVQLGQEQRARHVVDRRRGRELELIADGRARFRPRERSPRLPEQRPPQHRRQRMLARARVRRGVGRPQRRQHGERVLHADRVRPQAPAWVAGAFDQPDHAPRLQVHQGEPLMPPRTRSALSDHTQPPSSSDSAWPTRWKRAGLPSAMSSRYSFG